MTMSDVSTRSTTFLEAELADAAANYLLLTKPLIDVFRGQKHDRALLAFRQLACALVHRQLGGANVPVPSGSRNIALALHRATLDLCRAMEVDPLDLIQEMNAASERHVADQDSALDKVKALLALLLVEGLAS